MTEKKFYIMGNGHIAMTSTGDKRNVWEQIFKMQSCEKCGKHFAPIDQLKYIGKKTGVPLKEMATCTDCR